MIQADDAQSSSLIAKTDIPEFEPILYHGKNFTKDALSRVPQDEEHYPYAEEPPKNITYPSYTIESVVGGPNKDNEYKVKWQDYTDTSWAPFASIKDSMALEEYRKKKK